MEKFELLKVIGQGTFGTVYKAKEKSSHQIFALKIMKNTFQSWSECENLREVKFLKIFEHENIVKLHEVIQDGYKLILVFEYMEMNIYELIKKNITLKTRISERLIKKIIKQILKALAFMEDHGFFHRDLKPENILITGQKVKIADFGLVKELNSQQPFSDYISTRWYRAPECLLNAPVYDSSIDIWAVGLIMTELYNLKPLFPGANGTDQLTRIFNVIGYPSFFHWPEGVLLAKKINFKLHNNINSVVFLDRLIANISQEGLNIIEEMLNLDPNCRPKAVDLLKHHYFSDKNERVLSAETNGARISNSINTSLNLNLKANLSSRAINLTNINPKITNFLLFESKKAPNLDVSFCNEESNSMSGLEQKLLKNSSKVKLDLGLLIQTLNEEDEEEKIINAIEDSNELSTSFMNPKNRIVRDIIDLNENSNQLTPRFKKKKDSVAAVKELISKKSHKFDLTQLPLLNLNANKERQTNNPQIQEKNLSSSKHLNFSPLFEGNKVNRDKSDYNTEQRIIFPKPKLLIPKHNSNTSATNSKEKIVKIASNLNNSKISPKKKEKRLFEKKLELKESSKFINLENYKTSINSCIVNLNNTLNKNVINLPMIRPSKEEKDNKDNKEINNNAHNFSILNPSLNNKVPSNSNTTTSNTNHKNTYSTSTNSIVNYNTTTFNLKKNGKSTKSIENINYQINSIVEEKDENNYFSYNLKLKKNNNNNPNPTNQPNEHSKPKDNKKDTKKKNFSGLRFLDNSFNENTNTNIINNNINKNCIEKNTLANMTIKKHEHDSIFSTNKQANKRKPFHEMLYEQESSLKKEALAKFKEFNNNKLKKGKKLLNNLNVNLLKFQKIELNGL